MLRHIIRMKNKGLVGRVFWEALCGNNSLGLN